MQDSDEENTEDMEMAEMQQHRANSHRTLEAAVAAEFDDVAPKKAEGEGGSGSKRPSRADAGASSGGDEEAPAVGLAPLSPSAEESKRASAKKRGSKRTLEALDQIDVAVEAAAEGQAPAAEKPARKAKKSTASAGDEGAGAGVAAAAAAAEEDAAAAAKLKRKSSKRAMAAEDS